MNTPVITLRPAEEEDCRMLWEWANDPKVRASAFSTDSIPWEDHTQWFHNKLIDDTCIFLIAENEEHVPVGQIRFDLEENGSAVIDVNIAEQHRRRGYATPIINAGIKHLFANTDSKRADAFVKIDNEASSKTFQSAGFNDSGITSMKGYEVYHFTLPRP